MANVVLNPQLQEYGTGSEVALAIKQYSGTILTAFQTSLVFGKYPRKKYISTGRSHQFPASAKASAEEHTAGTELAGNNQPEMEERLVIVDDKQVMSHRYFDEVQEFISHYDIRSIAATEHGQAVAKTIDGRLANCIALGARESDRGTGDDLFPGGHRVQAGTSGAVTVAYPISLAGSLALQEDFEEIGRGMDDDDVPEVGRVAFVTPYLRDVLLQDKTLVSADFQNSNTMLMQKLVLCKRFRIEVTNCMPSELIDTGPSAYQGDFTLTAALCIGHSDAFGQVLFGGGVRPISVEWITRVQSWIQGAKILQGAKWLRPEACGEIYLDN